MKVFLLMFFIVGSFCCGCKKEDSKHSCYDKSIVHNNPCTADCPGITGCDGKTYCNECEAARQGIRPK